MYKLNLHCQLKSAFNVEAKNLTIRDNNKNKNRFNKILCLFLLLIFNLGFSQLSLENFNSGIPSSWAVTSNLTVANNWSPTASGYQATGGSFVNPASNNTVGSTARYYMISPQFLTPTNGEIRFFNRQGSAVNRGATYEVRISTADQPDISSFNVVLGTWTEAQLSVIGTTYTENIVSLGTIPSGIPVYIAFVAVTNQLGTTATNGDSWFIDNVRVIPKCTAVTGINSTVTPESAIINWTHPSATEFSYQIVPSGVGIGTTGTPISGFTHTASALTANTTYDFWIRTNCDPTTSSAWAGPFSFTTNQAGLSCASPIIIPDVTSTPYILSSNLADYYSATDYTQYTTVGSNCFPSGTYNYLLGNHLFFNYTPTTTGLIDIRQEVIVISGGGTDACFNGLSSVMVYDSCADVGVSCLAAIKTGTSSSESLIGQISNFYVEAGNTYVIVMSSPYNPGSASVCFNFTVSGSNCPAPAPSGTTYNNLTQTSADFSWGNVGNLVSAWEYVVLPVSSGAPSGTTVLTSTTTNLNNSTESLIPATNYNLYVRSVCNGTPGPWAAPLTFTTPCDVLDLPYETGFTNSSETQCWSRLNLNNDFNFFTFGNSAFSEPVARIRPQNSNDMLISPQFHFDGVAQKRLRFKYNIYGNWGLIIDNPTGGQGSFEIRLSTTGIGPNNFTTVLVPLAEYTTAYNFIEMIVPLPNIVGDVNIAWVLPEGATQTGIQTYFDDVFIENLPACSEPSYPVVTPGSITSTTATISWTNGYNNSQWELVAQPLGTGIPTTPGIIVNSNPYTLENLDPSTRYEFYMRAYCSSAEQSIWVGPINFNTLCIAQNTPYYESLNDTDVTTKKFCWSVNNVDGSLTQWRIEETEANIRALSTMSQPFTTFDDWLISAPINAVGLKRLRFSHRAVNGIFNPTPRGNVEVLMSSTQDFSSYTVLIPSFDFVNLAYEEKAVLFTGTGTTYIAFRVPPTMTNPGNSGIIMIDDVYVEDAPPCPTPGNLAVSTITTSTANLSWAAGYTETQWQVVVQIAGTGIPTGTGSPVNIIPTFNATGLTQDTLYEYYVRAVCGSNGNSQWIGPLTFRTNCNALPTPFLETFNSDSSTESCWRAVNGNVDTNDWNLNQTVNPVFGDQMAALFTGNNGNNNDWLITPTITANANQRLRFYYKVYDDFFEEDLKVMLSTNGTATNQFTTILYENSLNSFTNETGVVAGSNSITLATAEDAARVRPGDFIYIPGFPFPFPTYVATVQGTLITMTTTATLTQTGVQNIQFEHEAINNEEVREMVINLTGITAPTNINLAFHTPYFPPNPWAYRSQYTFIDNVIVEDIPACPSVINVTTDNLIDTSVQLDWETVGAAAASWEISVQPYGTTAPVGATLPQYLHTTSTHPYTVNGLTPATQYQFYIRAICSETSQSEWVGPFEFTTRCDYTNVCEYTITTISGNSGQVTRSVNVMQNGVVTQELEFPGFGQTSIDYTVFLCSGVAFDLYWDGMGSGVQYSQAQIIVKDATNTIIWTSPLGLGTVNTNIYSGFATCGPITCPKPTNLSVNNQGVLSWTPGASESQWEVFVQPYENGTLPQTGTLVSSPSYTPIATDFVDASASTYEYFVRAVCSASNKSYWSGPKVFIRNDEATSSVTLPINSGNQCNVSGKDVSFIGATVSSNPTTCDGTNGGDVWFDFVATSKVHTIELSDFAPGNYYTSSFEGPWPKIIMSLYEVQLDGSLIEKGCSENNSLVTIYNTELIVGKTYKIRLKLDSLISNNKKFKICISTPTDLCDLNAFNYDFEKLTMQSVTGVSTIINALVVPGWRVNTAAGQMFFQEQNNSLNVTPYSGGQCVQLIQDNEATWNPSDPNIKGLYKDFDTSEIKKMDYSFASATRTGNTTVQLFAGPPSGPFTLVTEHNAFSLVWQVIQGSYTIPAGQNTTRFIFRTKGNIGGHILDAANFKANTDIETSNSTLSCEDASINVQANGLGEWIASTTNPSATVIASPTSNSTTISGFSVGGDYIYTWKTRYCEKNITVTYQALTETPSVTNLNYCLNEVTSPLTASVSPGFITKWYVASEGGVGSANAPTPDTSSIGTTTYYVAAVNGDGCEGPRVSITVQVISLPTATITGATTICTGNTTTISFSGTPNSEVTFTENSGANQTLPLDNDGLASFTTPVLTDTTTYTLVNVEVVGSTTCAQVYNQDIVVTVTPLATPDLIFSYNDVCILSTTNPLPSLGTNFAIGGTFSSTTLDVNDSTGEINLATATAGDHQITYFLAPNAVACTSGGTHVATITINPSITQEVSFSYATTCVLSTTNPLPNLGTNFATGGTFSSTTLSVNDSTGEINLATATAGDHQITYTLAPNAVACTSGGTHVATITINPSITQEVSFSYATTCILSTTNPLPSLGTNFATGGTFSSTTLDVNDSTGEINLATATVGDHQITYLIASDNVNCTSAGTLTVTMTITASTTSDVVFSYNPTCVIAASNPLPVVSGTFTTGGTFSSTTLSVNGSTGEINLATATAGDHQVTYALTPNEVACTSGGTHVATITINASSSPVTSFTYSSTFCSENTNETPSLSAGFTTDGIFTATNGLVINATTGEISITNSSSGNYTITYSVLADSSICRSAGSSMFSILVTNDFAINAEDSCENESLILSALPVNDSFNPSIANYVWSNSNNTTIGTNSPTFDVTAYLSQNATVSIPFTVNVSVEVNGCSSTTSFVVENDPCRLIPRGVSPNGDGDNDTFDLSGLNVKELVIFNRYGARVYSFEGNYTNQWHGQTDKGDLLPDATYFYSIVKEGGKSVSGWVYVNK